MCQICGNLRSKHLRHWTEVENHERFNKELDTMPDGIHAKLYKHWEFNKTNRNQGWKDGAGSETVRPKETKEEREAAKLKLRTDWQALPEPKPDYFEWGADQSKPELLEMLRDTAINGKRLSDRTKAADVLLKHGKIPPKQTIKLEGRDENIDVNELLAKICELMKIPVDEPVILRKFLTSTAPQ